MTEEDRAKYEEEKAKVIEEWSDIELRFKDGPPRSNSEESNEEESTLGRQGNGTRNDNNGEFVEEIFQNALWRRIFEMNYDNAMADARKELLDNNNGKEASASYPFSGLLFLRRCVCRPPGDDVEIIKNDRLRTQRELLVALAATPYSPASIEHYHLLLDFFRKASRASMGDMAQVATCNRTGTHWQLVGFQGVDPSTDLRGVGILGLLQLHYLVSEWGLPEEQVATILKFSRDDKQNFPFAIVGLNFTHLVVTRLKSGELNGLANIHNSFLDTINCIYRGCFIAFYRDWKATAKSILDFQPALTKIDRVLTRDPSALYNMKWVDMPEDSPRPAT